MTWVRPVPDQAATLYGLTKKQLDGFFDRSRHRNLYLCAFLWTDGLYTDYTGGIAGALVIFCWHHRRGKHHEITIERIHYVPTGSSRRDVMALTVILSARLESVIRAVPEQWVWMHKRWRKISQEYVLGATA
ncbi:MAG: hypothetical protein E6J74_02795 [Deltaproteobacteria bacterium]|nr:MAG: hypothetical protein E6J74_02795 [Deltaproteobacteria bacterium]